MRALAQAADGAGTLKARTLALWVAQNRLAARQLASLAAPGRTQARPCRPACVRVARNGCRHAEPAFRVIDIVVAEPAAPGLRARAPGRLRRQRPAAMTHAPRCRARLHADRGAGRARASRRDRGARVSRDRRPGRRRIAAVRRSEALAHARSLVRAPRSRPAAGAAARRRATAARVEPAWCGAGRGQRGQSAHRVLARRDRSSPSSRVRGPAHRLPACAATALEVVYWPTLDNVDDARATAYPLVDGVARFRVRISRRQRMAAALAASAATPALPRAVRVAARRSPTARRSSAWFVLR